MRFISWLHRVAAHVKPQKVGYTPVRLAFKRPWPRTLRGLALWLFSVALFILATINYIFTDVPSGRVPGTNIGSPPTMSFAYEIMGTTEWGYVMVVISLITAFCSYCHKNRDQWGYLILVVFFFVWGMGFVVGWALFDAPLRSLGSAAIWITFSTALLCIAGFPNVPLAYHNRPGAEAKK